MDIYYYMRKFRSFWNRQKAFETPINYTALSTNLFQKSIDLFQFWLPIKKVCRLQKKDNTGRRQRTRWNTCRLCEKSTWTNTQQDQGILLCVKQEYLFTSFVYNGYWSTINIAELDLHNWQREQSYFSRSSHWVLGRRRQHVSCQRVYCFWNNSVFYLLDRTTITIHLHFNLVLILSCQ